MRHVSPHGMNRVLKKKGDSLDALSLNTSEADVPSSSYHRGQFGKHTKIKRCHTHEAINILPSIMS